MLSINTPKQLLEKAKYSNEKLEGLYSNPEYDYVLFDTIFTVSHMYEWFLKDKNIPQGDICKCIRNFNPYESPYDVASEFKSLYKNLNKFPEVNYNQLNIRLLCNKGKHFKKNDLERETIEYTAQCGHPSMVCGGQYAQAGGYMVKYIIEVNGKDMNIEELLSQLIHEWDVFIT